MLTSAEAAPSLQMAFVLHTLPPTRRPSASRRSAACPTMGVISVARRRRMYDFMKDAAGTPTTPKAPALAPKSSSIKVPVPVSPLIPEYKPPEFVSTDGGSPAAEEVVANRLAEAETAIKKDAEIKQRKWLDEIAALRTPPKPESPLADSMVGKESISSSSEAPVSNTPITKDIPTASAPANSATGAPSAQGAASSSITSRDSPSASQPPSSVSELYGPPATSASSTSPEQTSPSEGVQRPSVPFLSNAFKSVVDATERAFGGAAETIEDFAEDRIDDAKEAIEKIVDDGDDSDDSVAEQMLEKMASGAGEFLDSLSDDDDEKPKVELGTSDDEDAKFAEKMLSQVLDQVGELTDGISQEEADKILASSEEISSGVPDEAKSGNDDKKNIGSKLLDAIVEGVETPTSGLDEKSDLVELVETGKVKNLTVTKLRRLLSANGLKTSGRKSELIARLTSFANAK